MLQKLTFCLLISVYCPKQKQWIDTRIASLENVRKLTNAAVEGDVDASLLQSRLKPFVEPLVMLLQDKRSAPQLIQEICKTITTIVGALASLFDLDFFKLVTPLCDLTKIINPAIVTPARECLTEIVTHCRTPPHTRGDACLQLVMTHAHEAQHELIRKNCIIVMDKAVGIWQEEELHQYVDQICATLESGIKDRDVDVRHHAKNAFVTFWSLRERFTSGSLVNTTAFSEPADSLLREKFSHGAKRALMQLENCSSQLRDHIGTMVDQSPHKNAQVRARHATTPSPSPGQRRPKSKRPRHSAGLRF